MKKHLCLLLAGMMLLAITMQGCKNKTKPAVPESTAQIAASSEVPVTTRIPGSTADAAVPSAVTEPSTERLTEPETAAEIETQPETAPVETELPAETELPTESVLPTETAPIDRPDPDDPMIRWKNAGFRTYLPEEPVDLVPFSDMEYVHPDTDDLYAKFDALIAAAETAHAEELLESYYQVYDAYVEFYSMDTLANLHHSLDITDVYYNEEYDFCENETPKVEEKLEALYKAFAASPWRNELEDQYFGEGYFLQYDDYEVYTNEEYLHLSQEEAAILTQYRALLADPTVEINGEEQSFWELLESDDYSTYFAALEAYYEKYNPKIGELYLQLVKIRKQLAEALDYDSYAAYSYEMTYSRDYSPEQGMQFIQEIEDELLPVYDSVQNSFALSLLSHKPVTENQVKAMVKSAAEQIGGTVADAYRFMEAYELFDITKAAEKTDSSFQTYIYKYEAPFVFVNSQGNSQDYTTLSHEFGHFTDSYYNYGANEDLETAETYSQAMEFLALRYTDKLSESEKKTFIKLKLVDLLETFISQAAYARFEAEVYELPEEELTLDRVNEIFLQVNKDFGFYSYGYDFYFSQSWIDIVHFFEVPYYVISYCVSADTALQVYQREAASAGDGIAVYFELLNRNLEAGVQQVMEDAGLDNPFRAGSLNETAQFFRDQLNLR